MVELEILKETVSSDPLGGTLLENVGIIKGYLDMTSGTDDTKSNNNAFFEASTHVLLTRDFDSGLTENMKLRLSSKVYHVLYIDDPVNINNHLEIYLKFEGYAQ